MRVLTAAEIRGLESCAVESGVSMETLMENAGAEVAAAVTEKMDVTGKKTVILCGKGNNGGDGFVAARLLAAEGAKVTVVLMQGAPASDLAKQAYDKMGRGIEIIMYRTAGGAVDAADVIIDAVFGFSFHGRLPSVMEPLLARAAENKKAFHISVDIPSGAVCDTGAVEGACFKADLTVTFTAMKPAGVVYPAAGFGGMTVVRQVGIKEEHLEMLPCDTESVLLGNICPLFPKRDPEGHKGTYGRLLMICGSVGMAGACIMAARAALRSGVGLLNIAIPHALYPILAPAVPEAIFTLYDPTEAPGEAVLDAIDKASACLVGCGARHGAVCGKACGCRTRKCARDGRSGCGRAEYPCQNAGKTTCAASPGHHHAAPGGNVPSKRPHHGRAACRPFADCTCLCADVPRYHRAKGCGHNYRSAER